MFEHLFSSSFSGSLLAGILSLLFLYLYFSFQEKKKEPPGPKPLPLLGNLLQLDLKRIDSCLFDVRDALSGKNVGFNPLVSGELIILVILILFLLLFQLSKKYGSVFTVYFAHKKVVVLAGYRAVKQALVNQGVEFGDRDISAIFHDFNKGNGKAFSSV